MAKKRILIVDDSADIRDVYEILLTNAGYEIETAATGEEALAKVRAERPDLILSDVVMPGMDGLELVTHLRSDFAPPLPPVILWSGFDITEEEALRRGALMFLRKPLSGQDVLDFVAYGLRGERVDPAALARQRSESTRARKRAHEAAAHLKARLDMEKLANRATGQLIWLRSYFGVADAVIAVIEDQRLVVVDGGGDPNWPRGTDITDRVPYGLEVIETGSSLMLGDASRHPSFAGAGKALQGIRFFAGVPLVAPEGVAIGVLSMFDSGPRAFQAEDLLILEIIGRKGSEFLEALAAGRPTAAGFSPKAGLAIASTFQAILDAELRLLERQGGSMEVAIVEMDDPSAISEAILRQADRERLAGGILGPWRGALFKRSHGPSAAHVIDQVLRGLPAYRGAGVVSLASAELAAVGASVLLRVATVALERALQAGGGAWRSSLRRQEDDAAHQNV